MSQSHLNTDLEASLITRTKTSLHARFDGISMRSILRQVSSCIHATSCRVVDINNNNKNENKGDVLKTCQTSTISCTTNSSTAAANIVEIPTSSPRLSQSSSNSDHALRPNRHVLARLVRRVLSNAWIQPFILFLMCLQLTVLIIGTTNRNLDLFTFYVPWHDVCYLVVFIFYTLELVCKGVAYWFGQGTAFNKSRITLRNLYNILDLLSIAAYWINFIMMLAKAPQSRLRQFLAMLSALRILRLLRITTGTESETMIIFEALNESGAKLGKVASFICFFWLLFAVIGVQAFKSSMKRSCVVSDTDSIDLITTLSKQAQFCGGHIIERFGSIEAQSWLKRDGNLGPSGPKGYLCPLGMICQENANPYNGTVSFDNIFQSLELVFITFSANTFSTLMYNVMDSEGLAAALFFAAVIIVLYFWLLILLIGVITGSIQEVRQKLPTPVSRNDSVLTPTSAGLEVTTKHRTLSLIRKAFQRTKWFWILTIAINLTLQAQRTSTMSLSRSRIIVCSESIVTWILLLEIMLRFIMDWRHFYCSKQNMTDLSLAIVTSTMQIPSFQRAGRVYTWFTVFQIARSYRVFWAINPVRNIMVGVPHH
jgi:hypothetical protein